MVHDGARYTVRALLFIVLPVTQAAHHPRAIRALCGFFQSNLPCPQSSSRKQGIEMVVDARD